MRTLGVTQQVSCSRVAHDPMRLWSDLPRDLLVKIAEKLTQHADFILFGSVCKCWHSVVLDNLHQLPYKLPLCHCFPYKQPLPLLLHFYDQELVTRVDFLSIKDQEVFGGFQLPEASHRWIAGSSYGWLVTIETHGLCQVHLLNPLTRAQIELPSLSAFTSPSDGQDREDVDNFAFVDKVILSTKPNGRNPNKCVAMALTTGLTLSFCELGDKKWTNVVDSPWHINDVITYRGHFYAVTDRGALVSCDMLNGMSITVVAVGGGITDNWGIVRYLVESPSGELWQVVRQFTEEPWQTCRFIIYKLEAVDESENQRTGTCASSSQKSLTYVKSQREPRFRWAKVESLGDSILFVGCNSSLALPASSYPGCKANRIFFSDDSEGHRVRIEFPGEEYYGMDFLDMGVYSLDDESICRFEEANFNSCFTVPPLWFTPNPW